MFLISKKIKIIGLMFMFGVSLSSAFFSNYLSPKLNKNPNMIVSEAKNKVIKNHYPLFKNHFFTTFFQDIFKINHSKNKVYLEINQKILIAKLQEFVFDLIKQHSNSLGIKSSEMQGKIFYFLNPDKIVDVLVYWGSANYLKENRYVDFFSIDLNF